MLEWFDRAYEGSWAVVHGGTLSIVCGTILLDEALVSLQVHFMAPLGSWRRCHIFDFRRFQHSLRGAMYAISSCRMPLGPHISFWLLVSLVRHMSYMNRKRKFGLHGSCASI